MRKQRNLNTAILFIFLLIGIGQALEGDSCVTSNGCKSLHNCIDLECIHKGIWPPTLQEILGSILLLTLIGFFQAGGMGGGPINVALLL